MRLPWLAVAFGMMPSLAAWALVLIETSLRVAGSSLHAVADRFGADLYIDGLIALSQGFVFTSTILASMLAGMIDRRFDLAAAWSLAAAVLSYFGIIHAFRLTEAGVQNHFGLNVAPQFSLLYLLSAALLWTLHRFSHGRSAAPG